MSDSPAHFVFAGGGTGGHLYPGLAIAEALKAANENVRITFFGCGRAWHRRAVERAGFERHEVACHPWRRGPVGFARFVSRNLRGFRQARRWLNEHEVAAVVGLGGYVSAPLVRAATNLATPLVLIEPNVIPGRVTRWMADRAQLVCAGFAETAARLGARATVRVTGVPIRREFRDAAVPRAMPELRRPPERTDRQPRTLLALGGSGGAATLNEAIPRIIRAAPARFAGWRIVHQSGVADFEPTQRRYGSLSTPVQVRPFIDDLAGEARDADLAICRAGASTLSELAALAVPAVVVPFPGAADDHQRHNARWYETSGGAVCVEQDAAERRWSDRLAARTYALLANEALRRKMAERMAVVARGDAAQEAARLIVQLGDRSGACQKPNTATAAPRRLALSRR